MRYVPTYLLAVLGGNGKEPVTAKDVAKILSSVGTDVAADRQALTIKALEDKIKKELIAAGWEKLSPLPFEGGEVPKLPLSALL